MHLVVYIHVFRYSAPRNFRLKNPALKENTPVASSVGAEASHPDSSTDGLLTLRVLRPIFVIFRSLRSHSEQSIRDLITIRCHVGPQRVVCSMSAQASHISQTVRGSLYLTRNTLLLYIIFLYGLLSIFLVFLKTPI